MRRWNQREHRVGERNLIANVGEAFLAPSETTTESPISVIHSEFSSQSDYPPSSSSSLGARGQQRVKCGGPTSFLGEIKKLSAVGASSPSLWYHRTPVWTQRYACKLCHLDYPHPPTPYTRDSKQKVFKSYSKIKSNVTIRLSEGIKENLSIKYNTIFFIIINPFMGKPISR